MMNITAYTVEKINDPFGILTGDRYEFMIEIDVEEDDELFMENGVVVKALYKVEDGEEKFLKYDLMERNTDNVLDFELEDDEINFIQTFCSEHWQEAEEA
ncbi:DUF6509 family protein [Jeotgalibacillus sp. R-1-5s-1]|uniref:DUF6509 family protein n=1 Tax=Jeotgalibacillus sp. R-1-5s-1 TaxID=2555897 RepID=UPI0010694427|nr:DUF6509 family protein [Jeotgalibacillus sp. R-1-5s-1]TFE01174.1 pullulanase [Jeotgalibacillus sp. R-1-5s-1]